MSISRAELYGFDSKGRRIKSMRNADVKCRSCRVKQRDCPSGDGKSCCAECWHPQVMRAKSGSSPPIMDVIPEARANELTEQELDRAARTARRAKFEQAMATLTPEERSVLELKAERVSRIDTREVVLQELVDAREKGWELVSHSNGIATVTGEVFVKLDYDEMGKRLGLTARQVHRRMAAANRKLRSAME